ncbi:MAG TPA: adenylate/guanylate cyclase domain-containing protein, partial [Candidatus Ozemobacteraceae bacterium]|nr:adenylate/guanylate cyclase domain-containing protein [Candidatus Ozemobacteraceae bacterium]
PDSFTIPPARLIALDFLLQGAKDEESDLALVQAIRQSSATVILGGQTTVEVEQGDETRVKAVSFASGTFKHDVLQLDQKVSVILPHQPFLDVCPNVGFINVGQSKGFVRRVPLFVPDPTNRKLLPSFSLLISATALDNQSENPGRMLYQRAMYSELERIGEQMRNGTYVGDFLLHDIPIPTDPQGNMEVYFFGSTQRIRESRPILPSVSFYECFDEPKLEFYRTRNPQQAAKLMPQAAHLNSASAQKTRNFGNKVCLLGTFERSDFDFYETPLTLKTPVPLESEQLMGIEIHANAVLTILNRKFIHPPNTMHTFILLVFATLLLGFLIDHLKPLLGGLATLSGILGIFGLAYYSYQSQGQILYISPFLVSFPMSWFSSTLIGYLHQQAKALSIKSMFQRFVSADVVQYMIDNPDKVAPGGQRVELTVFFSDVAGFTSISEMLTPEELVVLLNEYLGAMTDILFEFGGTLDKFIGDAVMCFWNYPRAQEDHAVRACLCAIRMQEKIRELQIGWAKRGLPKVSARAGINTAQVVVGYMGSEKAQMNFTCMGDGVNLASRLEGANKEYGTDLMVSDACYQKAKHKVTARFLDFLAVKGKKEPVKVHNLVCEKGKEPPDWEEFISMYDKAIKLHLDRQWDEAIATFEALLARWPEDGPSKTYIHRCKEYKENPPPENWDGSYHLTHK